MVVKEHERTFKMMENFISLHNEGYSIKEIAKKYSLSTTTVYNRLEEIAEKAGVTRKELLKKPFIADHSGRNFTPVKPIDRKSFNEGYDVLMRAVDALSAEIGKTIEDIEIMNELLVEEMKK